jgi:hypothetical protein
MLVNETVTESPPILSSLVLNQPKIPSITPLSLARSYKATACSWILIPLSITDKIVAEREIRVPTVLAAIGTNALIVSIYGYKLQYFFE